MERKENAKHFLKKNQLRPTKIRQEIYEILQQASFALSHCDIMSQIKKPCDRVTVYRTLETFMEKGLAHKILDEHGIAQFALCAPQEETDCSRMKNHLHFRCSICGRTFCLENREVTDLQLPEGFLLDAYSIAAKGCCKTCAQF